MNRPLRFAVTLLPAVSVAGPASQGRFGDVAIGNVQFGYEITSSAGGKDFVTNAFSVTG